MGFGISFAKFRSRLVRAPWSKDPEIQNSKSKPTKKKPEKPKHHWLSPNYGAGSTPTLRSNVSALDLDDSSKRGSVHDLEELDSSWSSRRKSSLNRLSAANMTYIEEVRIPKFQEQYQYVPLFLDLASCESTISSEGIEMEMETDFERRGSIPTSPKKSIPQQRIGTPSRPISPRNLARQALSMGRTMSFVSATDKVIAEDETSEPRPPSTSIRKLRPAPLDLSARRRSSDGVISVFFTPGWIAPLCASPESISPQSIFSRRSSGSSRTSRQSSLMLSDTDSQPIHILRPCPRQSMKCVLSETPDDALWSMRLQPDSPRSIASRSSTASKTTVAKWFALSRKNGECDV